MAVSNIYYGVNGQSEEIDKLYAPTPEGKSVLIYEKPSDKHIYGVEWSGTSVTNMLRTNDSTNFADPVPALSNGIGSSPFDDCYPWKDIKRVTDSVGGELVEIPKFWYKIAKNGIKMTFQIADYAADGFYVSPAHMDRGDGSGERDVVYVGRYHCATSTYKSTSGVLPANTITRANFRTYIHNLGSTIWQWDYAMLVTIWLLYLVEFADWNSQAKIGYGCSDSGSKQNSGLTDSMQYHTGTTKSSRTTYGHTQYRYMEDLWGNIYTYCDGIYFSSANVYCIKNPASFSDTSGGTLIGTRDTSNGYVTAFFVPTASGFEYAIYPSAVGGSDSTYVTDYCSYNASGVVLSIGGGAGQDQGKGLFYTNGAYTASSYSAYNGSRLMKLP